MRDITQLHELSEQPTYRDFFRKKNHWKKDFFFIFAQNIHCDYTLEILCSNEYPQYTFWVKNKKIRYTPALPSFAI